MLSNHYREHAPLEPYTSENAVSEDQDKREGCQPVQCVCTVQYVVVLFIINLKSFLRGRLCQVAIPKKFWKIPTQPTEVHLLCIDGVISKGLTPPPPSTFSRAHYCSLSGKGCKARGRNIYLCDASWGRLWSAGDVSLYVANYKPNLWKQACPIYKVCIHRALPM